MSDIEEDRTRLAGRIGFEPAEAAIANARTADARGRHFERACDYLLRHAPEYGLAEVWPWREWSGREAAGYGLQDLGIDLVGKTVSGALWAIQAKFRTNPGKALTWEELATFVGHSARSDLFAYRLVITNTWAVPARFEKATAGQAIGWLGRADLLDLGIDWRPFLEPTAKPVSPRKTARPHQEAAIRDVVAHLHGHERGQLIMACGTGKTLTTLWLAATRQDERVLVLVPSLSLLRQFRREWLESADPVLALADLCVCSDITVAGGQIRGLTDDLEERAADLGVPVTTDPAAIAAFLRGDGRRVVFATYQSSPRIAEAMADPGVPAFDLAIADEAHRLAAGTDRSFATILDGAMIRASRRLFTTATPRYLAPHVKRRAEEEEVEVVSMDDPEIFGAVAHHLSFGQAIEQDLLSDYRVIVLATRDTADAGLIQSRRLVTMEGDAFVTDAATLATLVGVKRAVDELGLRRLVSFHRTVERARTFARAAGAASAIDLGHRRGHLETDYVSGGMTAGERAQKLDRLRRVDGSAVLLANARCLTEGVDVPSLDGLVFVDPRWSPIDIVQAVGRVIRKAAEKTLGTIVIPVVVPDEAEPATVLERSSFETVWSVVRALRSHDERLAEVLSATRTALGRTGKPADSAFVAAHFGVLDLPAALDAARFAEAIELRIVEAGSFNWDAGLGHLLAFVEEHGHSSVRATFQAEDGFGLGGWAVRQRYDYRNGRLGHSRVDSLQRVKGWTWDPYESDFREGVDALKAFVALHHHALVPPAYRDPDGYQLGSWVGVRRSEYRAGRLVPERADILQGLPGWTWDKRSHNFERGLEALHTFARRHGHARVPRGYRAPAGFSLGSWVLQRRRDHRIGHLPPERIAALEAVPGWSWAPHEHGFDVGLRHLIEFAAAEGHCRVPSEFKTDDGFRLGRWVVNQRGRRKSLSGERGQALEAISGWSWNTRTDNFERGIQALRAYAARHGHTRVPRTDTDADGFKLGLWAQSRRADRRMGRLPASQAAALMAVSGWADNAIEDRFRQGLRALAEFAATNGHTRIPRDFQTPHGFLLGNWARHRREEYRAGRLSQDRGAALEAVPGWTW